MCHEEEKGCSGREVLSQGWRIGRCFFDDDEKNRFVIQKGLFIYL